jgi:hypothetical protein
VDEATQTGRLAFRAVLVVVAQEITAQAVLELPDKAILAAQGREHTAVVAAGQVLLALPAACLQVKAVLAYPPL